MLTPIEDAVIALSVFNILAWMSKLVRKPKPVVIVAIPHGLMSAVEYAEFYGQLKRDESRVYVIAKHTPQQSLPNVQVIK